MGNILAGIAAIGGAAMTIYNTTKLKGCSCNTSTNYAYRYNMIAAILFSVAAVVSFGLWVAERKTSIKRSSRFAIKFIPIALCVAATGLVGASISKVHNDCNCHGYKAKDIGIGFVVAAAIITILQLA